MIRIDALWLATEPLDMRAGTESALARVVAVFGAARPHHAYLFANPRRPPKVLHLWPPKLLTWSAQEEQVSAS